MACTIPEPCKFLSLDSCQKRFLCTHMEVDLALHPVIGFEPLPEKFSQALGLESLDPFFVCLFLFSQHAGFVVVVVLF